MKKFLVVLCVMVLLLCAGCSISEKLPGKFSDYTAEGEFMVTNGGISGDGVSNTDIAASVNFLPTIKTIVKSDDFLKSLYQNLEADISFEDFKKSLSIQQTENYSLIFQVEVKADNQETADEILDCLQENLPEYIQNKVPGIKILW